MRAPHDELASLAVAVAAVAVPLTRAELGSFAAATASRIIWSGCSMPRLTPERITGLPAKRLRLAHVDVGREDHRVRVVDRALRERLVAARALRLDDEVDAGLLARGGERVGGHERVGDAGRTRGDRHDAGRVVPRR